MKTKIQSFFRLLALILLAIIAAYALFFLIRGRGGEVVILTGEASSPGVATYAPDLLALPPLILAVITGWALIKKKNGVLWLGSGMLVAFSIITIFSLGYPLIYIIATFLIILLIVQFSGNTV